jgi:hypothetical protein
VVVERVGKTKDHINGKLNVDDTNPNADDPGKVGWSASNTFYWSINTDGVGVNRSNTQGMYSFHSGDTSVGIADGSVRVLSVSKKFETLVKL